MTRNGSNLRSVPAVLEKGRGATRADNAHDVPWVVKRHKQPHSPVKCAVIGHRRHGESIFMMAGYFM
jgi:hypothetical protein